MAKPLRVKMSPTGARQLLNSAGVLADLQARGERVESAANAMLGPVPASDMYGYRLLDAQEGRNRGRVSVWTGGYTSRRDNSRNNTLLKALGS